MISSFEATILGFLSNRPCSRYEIMKAFQTTSIYWSGSPGAVYAAIARLEKQGLLHEGDSTGTKTFEVTADGLRALRAFLKVPIQAGKLLLDPVSLRIKLRGLGHLSVAERVQFCQAQMGEIDEAKRVISQRQKGSLQREINQRLANLALAQLDLEHELLSSLLAEELEDESAFT